MEKNQTKKPQKYYMSTLALTMLNVVMIAGLANDPQQAFYGLSSVTYFAIGFILSSSQQPLFQLNSLVAGHNAAVFFDGVVKESAKDGRLPV